MGQTAPAEVFSLASAALSAGQPAERELMVATRNYLIGVVPILDSGYANLYWMDVTERKRAEDEICSLNEQLRQRLEEMTLLLDLLPVGVWIGNHDCSEIRGNAAGYRIFGLNTGINASVTAAQPELPAGLLIRVNGIEVPPEELPMQKVARTGQPWNNFEHDITFPDGTIKTVYGSVAPLFDERGEVRQVIGAYAEFTERKRAEEALAEAMRQQEALYQCVERLHRADLLAEIYDAALDAILKALRCQRASILFYDEAGRRGLARKRAAARSGSARFRRCSLGLERPRKFPG
jgi:PAS domain-containing protein